MHASKIAALFVFALAAVAAAASGAPTTPTIRSPIAIPHEPLSSALPSRLLDAVAVPNVLPSTGAALFAQVPVGSPVSFLRTRLGAPWFVARLGEATYWVYSADSDHAWLVLTVQASKVSCVQIVPKAHLSTVLRDGEGYGIGFAPPSFATPYQSPQTFEMVEIPTHGQRTSYARIGSARMVRVAVHRPVENVVAISQGTVSRFYVLDGEHRISRFGSTSGIVDLPSIVRWFQPNGLSEMTPITESMAGGDSANARAAFVSKYDEHWWNCGGGAHWLAKGEEAESFAGVPEIGVRVTCPTRPGISREMYFAASGRQPRPFDADNASIREFLGRGDVAALTTGRRVANGAQPGAIWIVPGSNGAHWYYNTAGNSNFDVAVISTDDPNEPLQQIVVTSVTPPPQPFVSSTPAGASSSAVPFNAFVCAAVGGEQKCDPTLNDQSQTLGGQVCAEATAYFGTDANAYTQSSQIVCGTIVADARDYHICSRCLLGFPFDVVNGTLIYRYNDAKLSGPFGLEFGHQYESDRDTYQGELGLGWRSTYGAFLDLTTVTQNALVTFYDSSGARTYFQSNGPGSFYDQNSGSTLITNNNGTYTVQTWDHQIFKFGPNGRLTQLVDRNGNAQIIARDGTGRITTVTDPLGRSFTFTYNGTDTKIKKVLSSPAGVTLSFTYNSGTNCYTGDLCSVTESDGKKWSYQYVVEPDGENLLSAVVDANGNIEESDSYALVTAGYGATDYRLTEQTTGAGQDDLKISYSNGASGCNTVTDTPMAGQSNQSTFCFDATLNAVTSVSGFACHCGDDTISYTYDSFGRLLSKSERSATQSYSYGRDIPYAIPTASGGTDDVEAFPGATQIVDYSTPSRTVNVVFNPLASSLQDLPASTNEASVPNPTATAATTYTYNAAGLPTAIVRSGYVYRTPTSYMTSIGWDSNGRLTSVTQPRTDVNQTTMLSYFSNSDGDLFRRGQLSSVVDPLGHAMGFATAASGYGSSYTIYGEPQQITDVNGVLWQYMYDARGRLTSSGISTADTNSYAHLPGTILTTYGYDGIGNRTSIMRTLGGTAFSYDPSERLSTVSLINTAGTALDQETVGYDAESQLTSLTKACVGSNTSCSIGSVYGSSAPAYMAGYGYDTFGALTALSGGGVQGNSSTGGLPSPAPAASVALGSLVNNYRGDYTSDDFPSGNGSVDDMNSYDAFHQLTNITREGPAGLTSNVGYDTQHNVSAIVPGGGIGTTFAYDDFGRVSYETSLLTGSWSYAYDADGNLTNIVDPNLNVTTRTFDALNRPLTSTSRPEAGSASESVSWTYDNATAGAYGIGRLATMTDPTGSTTYSFEPRGFLVSKQQVVNNTTYSTGYSYDVDDDLATMTLPSGRVLTYGYDYAHRPISVSGVYNGATTNYVTGSVYLPFGPRAQLTYGNGVTQTFTFNQRYLPYENKVASSAGTLSDVAYAENNLGEITQIDDLLSPQYNRTLTYGASTLPQSMLASVTTGAGLWGTATYAGQNGSYNVDGEDLSSEVLGNTSLAITYDGHDHLNGISTNGGTPVGASADSAGNTATLNGATYTYSPRNLLATGEGITYGYDGFGQRNLTKSKTNTQVSLYDEGGHLSSETALQTTGIKYDYIWLGGTPVAQENLTSPVATLWTHTNELGAPFLQTSNAGAVTYQADYTPFGSVYALRTGAATTHQPLRLPGQEAIMFSSATSQNGISQLYFNHNRWYVPGIGRYLTPDPLGFAADPFNQYAYADNDPANEIDPSGTNPWDFANGALDYSTFGLTDFAGKGNTDYSGPSYQTGVGIGFVAGLFYGGTEWHIAGALAKIGSRLAINGGRFEANELSMASKIPCASADHAMGSEVAANNSTARFSQITASPYFSSSGTFSGQSIADVASQLRSGALGASDVSVQTVNLGSEDLIVNTRSALSLMQAGIPQSEWSIIDMTGDAFTESNIGARLIDNGLTNAGTDFLRITGSGPYTSTLIP